MNNKRLEDLMIRYAYGELEDHEIAIAEQLVATSPEAKRLFEIYSISSVGTKSLLEPPSPQLSTERLREAILSKEIKTVAGRSRNWIGIAVPTAAAMALAIYVFTPERAHQSQGTERVIAEQGHRSTPMPEISSATPLFEPPYAGEAISTTVKSQKPSPRASTKRSASRPETQFAPASEVSAESSKPTFETVVLINAGPSSADGTRDATELGHTTDVSFGN